MPKEKKEIETKQEVILPESGDNETDQKLIDNFLSHSDEEYRQMGEEIKEAERKREEEEKRRKEEEKIAKLKGNTDAILKDLKENHVRFEEDCEMMGYKGKKVHIELPAIGKFEGFKFDYFMSYSGVKKKVIEWHPILRNKLFSMKEIGKLLQAMNMYMIELDGKCDGSMDYENEIMERNAKPGYYRRAAGDCIKAITGLGNCYWLRDKNVAGERGSRAMLNCCVDHFFFRDVERDYCLCLPLFLRLSEKV